MTWAAGRNSFSRDHRPGFAAGGHGASIDTTTPASKLVFGIFAALAEFERDLISERTKAGLASARARGRKGGAPFKMTAAKVRLAMAAMGQKETKVADLCSELSITRQTLYRHVAPDGTLRKDGLKVVEGRQTRNRHGKIQLPPWLTPGFRPIATRTPSSRRAHQRRKWFMRSANSRKTNRPRLRKRGGMRQTAPIANRSTSGPGTARRLIGCDISCQ
jgi:Resolvase, N terminal domain